MSTKVLVIVPTYNESENITSFLTSLDAARSKLSEEFAITIMNVDDSSPDGTAKIARELNLQDFFQINNQTKSGLGPAYISGFSWGLERDYTLFVEIDADGSHSPEQLSKLLDSGLNHDLVIGTRWISGGSIVNWPWYRRAISKFGTFYAAKALKLKYRDLTSGYRVLNREFLSSLNLAHISNKGYGFQIEIAFQAFVNGFSIDEIPITFVERELGRSKMTLGIALEAFRFVSRLGFTLRLRGLLRR
ncbi:WcaA Glycosyltransferases involved in cell wall biogenesis [actinobacterium SCGC AAA044-D11]